MSLSVSLSVTTVVPSMVILKVSHLSSSYRCLDYKSHSNNIVYVCWPWLHFDVIDFFFCLSCTDSLFLSSPIGNNTIGVYASLIYTCSDSIWVQRENQEYLHSVRLFFVPLHGDDRCLQHPLQISIPHISVSHKYINSCESLSILQRKAPNQWGCIFLLVTVHSRVTPPPTALLSPHPLLPPSSHLSFFGPTCNIE